MIDGTSNTVMFGEVTGDVRAPIGTSTTGTNLNFRWINMPGMVTAWGLAKGGNPYRFTSHHTGIVQFAMGDGSVRGISTNMDNNMFRISLAGMGEGDVLGEF